MKVNRKIKTFQVSEDTHKLVADYCNDNSLKINPFVDKLLTNVMRNLNEKQKSD